MNLNGITKHRNGRVAWIFHVTLLRREWRSSIRSLLVAHTHFTLSDHTHTQTQTHVNTTNITTEKTLFHSGSIWCILFFFFVLCMLFMIQCVHTNWAWFMHKLINVTFNELAFLSLLCFGRSSLLTLQLWLWQKLLYIKHLQISNGLNERDVDDSNGKKHPELSRFYSVKQVGQIGVERFWHRFRWAYKIL